MVRCFPRYSDWIGCAIRQNSRACLLMLSLDTAASIRRLGEEKYLVTVPRTRGEGCTSVELFTVHVEWCPRPFSTLSCPEAGNPPRPQRQQRCVRHVREKIRAIARHCHQLQHLVVDLWPLTDTSIRAIGENCPHLVHLAVSSCGHLTDDSLLAIAQNCPKLQHLEANNLENLTDAAIQAIAQNCPELLHLDVSYCTRLTNLSVQAIVQNCPELQYLDRSHCIQVSAVHLKQFNSNAPHVFLND